MFEAFRKEWWVIRNDRKGIINMTGPFSLGRVLGDRRLPGGIVCHGKEVVYLPRARVATIRRRKELGRGVVEITVRPSS